LGRRIFVDLRNGSRCLARIAGTVPAASSTAAATAPLAALAALVGLFGGIRLDDPGRRAGRLLDIAGTFTGT
jgi:hypothetical protein